MKIGFGQRILIKGLFIFVLAADFAAAQNRSNPILSTDSIFKLYKKDADRLALRFVHSARSVYKDSVRIDPKRSAYYLKALLAVYNSTNLPARDTVVRFLSIHTYNPGMNALVLRGLSSLFWMDNLKNNRFPTGNSTLDVIMIKYDLKRTFYSNLFQPNLVVLSSGNNYNLEALACVMESVHGVSAIQPEFLYGDGNDITDTLVGSDLELTYSYGWDNCRNSCKNKRYWKFRVKEDFSVEYAGAWGPKLEPGLEMALSEGQTYFSNLNLFPNPSKDVLYVELTGVEQLAVKLSIVNHNGDLVYAKSILHSGEMIDLNHLLMGKYNLSLESEGKKKVFILEKSRNPLLGE